jgi:hypothetical protein
LSQLDQRILDKLEELVLFGERVKRSRYDRSSEDILYMGDDGVDYELAHHWGTSCLNLLSRVFGSESVHYRNFEILFPRFHDYSPIMQALGVLRAARDDYEEGFLFDTRILIEAEVFDDFLERAENLLNSGYFQPAAVVIGSVLEDGLRKLCARHNIPITNPKLDIMNANLAKQGVYNKLTRCAGFQSVRSSAKRSGESPTCWQK